MTESQEIQFFKMAEQKDISKTLSVSLESARNESHSAEEVHKAVFEAFGEDWTTTVTTIQEALDFAQSKRDIVREKLHA